MKIQKNDTVLVITGKDKGKKGKVLRTLPKEHRIVVEGVNIQCKHEKSKEQQPAQIIKVEGPIDVSNVMYFDGKQPVRIGYKTENGHKVRINKKTGQVIK